LSVPDEGYYNLYTLSVPYHSPCMFVTAHNSL
jgi:hypothetical protein